MPVSPLSRRELGYVARATCHHVPARHALAIARAAKATGLPYRYAFALVEHESGFRNVFGHDRGGLFPGQAVTGAKCWQLLRHVHAGGTSNGVGLTQLTWVGYLDAAHRRGGLSRPYVQCVVGFEALHALQRQHGEREGCRRYNGSGPAAEQYADRLVRASQAWHRILVGGS